MDCITSVLALKERHCHTWRTKSDWYWFWQMCEEFVELGLALMGLHRHTPDYELRQIASVAINWMEKRAKAEER